LIRRRPPPPPHVYRIIMQKLNRRRPKTKVAIEQFSESQM
jgi:hypothetical protein